MELTINGQARKLDPVQTLAELIDALDLGQKRLAVELNGQIVPRSAFVRTPVQEGDTLEIVHAIGGG